MNSVNWWSGQLIRRRFSREIRQYCADIYSDIRPLRWYNSDMEKELLSIEEHNKLSYETHMAITNHPRILILSNSSSGLYEFRNEVVEDLLSDHEVYISLPDEDAYTKILTDKGCHIFHTGFNRRGMNPIKDAILLVRYIGLIRRTRPQMVLTYTIKPNIYGGMACRLTHTKHAANITGLGTAIQGGGILSKVLIGMYRVALNKAKAVFYQNEYNMEFMLERGVGCKNQSILLPGSGVNITKHSYKPYPSEDRGVRVLAVLRIMKDKGIEEFLFAADRISDEFDAKFVLAGGYEEETRQEYEPQIQRLVEADKLEYVGFCDKIDELYENCHVLIHPSYHEGLSNVCLEAAACGRAVVTTDVPGCRETVVPGESGLLFKSKDKNATYKAIADILSMTSAERATMGQRGRNYVEENFNRETVVRKYREVVESVE